ncbi:MAG TPA: GlsB/YeaQ/YmgE family stress response membrane protein [Chloroflexia bacterium]
MGDCLGLIIMLVMLSALGWVIDLIVPGKMPYGWLGGIAAAIIGGLLGGFIFGNFGPAATFAGYTLSFIPALIGGIVFAFIVRFIMGQSGRRSL